MDGNEIQWWVLEKNGKIILEILSWIRFSRFVVVPSKILYCPFKHTNTWYFEFVVSHLLDCVDWNVVFSNGRINRRVCSR